MSLKTCKNELSKILTRSDRNMLQKVPRARLTLKNTAVFEQFRDRLRDRADRRSKAEIIDLKSLTKNDKNIENRTISKFAQVSGSYRVETDSGKIRGKNIKLFAKIKRSNFSERKIGLKPK